MGASKIFSKEFKGFLELCIVFLVSGINCYKNSLLHGSVAVNQIKGSLQDMSNK